ncbi:phytanoyl-CoA dioxygenase family protein [Boseongicola sp. H5]|uniref:phytanoyl-CoA dioxygenase family protein n=1 Tax=Rhodobacterales TaxID=204455 RepID=UPI001B18EDB2|nr:phytanoyl-CoA dioxygenase family protein [Boseongicola sp. H5]MBO6604840.1 phytanoyl-CoA dioxygenase family protein [Roseicyclus sp.]MBO6624994.1 phytanoyl-CoA dioxygenase family protein [Roseicyclus sp.]MBO6921942.1 phytanoyl-CoA dioxygenase family protein [Roseicyclus sp.]
MVLDLRFCPAAATGLSRLSATDIAAYNRDGFVQPFDIFTGPEIARIRAYFDRLMTRLGDAGAYGINCYQARMAGIWDIATDTRILDHVADIIGPDIICWASAILSKKPHDPKEVPWHQDASFWSLSPARTVTVWLAIDDADAANSAMRFIPGSHDKGALETTQTGATAVFHKGIADADRLGQPFTNTLKAGQISLHADMLVHGSEANRSDRRRCGLTLRYCPPEVRITDPDWARGVEAIICRGRDPSGHWRHHARPDNDDITKTQSPHVVGNN